MSIEQKIEALTAAIEALTAAINNAAGQPAVSEVRRGRPPKANAQKAEAPAEAPKVEAPAEVSKAETPAEAPKAEAPKAEAPKAEAPKAEAPTAEAPKGEVTLADLRQVVGQLAINKGRDAAVQALAKFGAAKLADLAPEMYAEVYAHCKGLL